MQPGQKKLFFLHGCKVSGVHQWYQFPADNRCGAYQLGWGVEVEGAIVLMFDDAVCLFFVISLPLGTYDLVGVSTRSMSYSEINLFLIPACPLIKMCRVQCLKKERKKVRKKERKEIK